MSPEYKLCLYMQDMHQVPHLILEYTWVLLNIMLHQTKVIIMTKHLVFVLKQTFRRYCGTFQILTFFILSKPNDPGLYTLPGFKKTLFHQPDNEQT